MYNKKVLSTAKKELTKAKAPKKPKDIITDPMGQWKYPGLPTRIPGNNITMEGVGYPVLGVANNGQRKIMLPGADYTFPGADYVDEYPQMKKGGERKKKKTKSITGTNKIMEKNPLLENYKNKIYDPNVDYFQEGGIKTTKSKDGAVTNVIQNPDGSKTVQVKTKDGKYYEKVIAAPATSINPLTGKPLVVIPKNATISNDYFNYKEEDGLKEDLGELVDPTGITSWDDVRRAYDENGVFDPKTGLEILGALPLIGKIGKSGKILAGGEKLFLDAVKYFGYNDVIANAYKAYTKMGGKNLDKVLGLTTKGLTKLSPKLNPVKWESNMKLINGLNKFTEAAKATKLFPYLPSGDTQRKNDDYIEAELTPEEIEEYRKGGYIVEDISVPELNQAQKGKSVNNTTSSKFTTYTAKNDKDYAFRKKAYDDSLTLHKLNLENEVLALKGNHMLNSKRGSYDPMKFKNLQNKMEYNSALQEQIIKNSNVPHKLIKSDKVRPGNRKGDFNYEHPRPTQMIIKPVELGEIIKKPRPETKKTKVVAPVKTNNKDTIIPTVAAVQSKYPVGYQPYSLYGKVLDPERYGYGESNEGKPIQLGQHMEAFGKELQMEKYKKADKYPWKKQEGGNSNYHKEGDSAYAWKVIPGKGAVTTHKHIDKNGNKTIKVIDSEGNHYIKTINKNGDVFNKTITKKELDEKAQKLSKNQMSMDDYMKNHGVGSAEWERKSSGAAQPVDWIWTLPMGGGRALAEEAGSLALQGAKGLFNLGKSAAKSNLVKLSKEGSKAFFNNTPKWITKVAPNLAPGMNLNNFLTSYGIVEGVNNYLDKNSDVRRANKKAYKNPNYKTITDAAYENILNTLDFSGLAMGNKIGKAAQVVKSKLPKYKNYYRIEPTSFEKKSSEGLTGRWIGELEDMPFYVKHLKDPNANVRLIRKRMKVSDWDKISGKNMSDEAKFMSIGTGEYNKYAEAAAAGLLPENMAKRITKGVPLESDIEFLANNKHLYNKREGIISDEEINKIRKGKKVFPISSWDKIEFSGDDRKSKALEYLFSLSDKNHKLNKNVLGIPREYLPFKEGGIVADLTQKEIDDYIAKGYIVEDVH